ncbi:MAG: zinc ABC transporter substrate-binding protein [Deltaproteobacteria bacterium]|nr:zinc ABC transporter substrate-binding protein [Candidatus Anaeroferrophillacea bacterium]
MADFRLPPFFRRLRRSLLPALAVFLLSPPAVFPVTAALRVAVSIPPQEWFVRQIGGDDVTVVTMVPAGTDPHTWEPRPSQLRALAAADIYFTIGIAFEDIWLPRLLAGSDRVTVVAADAGVEKISIHHRAMHGNDPSHAGRHDGEAGHVHQAVADPHVWLSPRAARRLAANMAAAFAARDPEHAAACRRRHDACRAAIDRLDEEIRRFLEAGPETCFLVYHPAWGYFARDYGLEQLAVEHHGTRPGPRALAGLRERIDRGGIRTMIVQPRDRATAASAAEILGVGMAAADPLAADWPAILRDFARLVRDHGGRCP